VILILGASSFIGRHLFQAWGPGKALGTHRSHPVPGSVFFDATRMRLLDTLPRPSQCSHAVICYAETKIDACKGDLLRSSELNVRSTKGVIDDLLRLGIKPIFLSSEYVFDGEQGHYTEEDPPNPITVYGSQKLEIERYLAQHGREHAILRLSKVLGTDPEDGTILSRWFTQIRQGEEIRCARDQVFSPIHVDDVVAAITAVIQLNLTGIFHVSNPASCSRLDLLRMLLEHLGEQEAAKRLEEAVARVLREGKSVTYDLKADRNDPSAVGTKEMADAIIAQLKTVKVSIR